MPDNTEIDGNTITVTVADDNGCAGTDSINVEGVRLSLVGSGRDNITASVTGTGDVRLLGGANTVTVMNSIVDELDDDGVDVDTTLTLIRHTGDPEDSRRHEVQVVDQGEHGAFLRWRADQSGVLRNSRGVEVTIDAWAATAEDLEEEDFVVDQTLTSPLTVTLEDGPDGTTADLMNAQLSINKVGTLLAVITAEDNKASVLTEQLMRSRRQRTIQVLTSINEMHTGGMLTSGVDVIIVLGSIDLGPTKTTCSRSAWTSR